MASQLINNKMNLMELEASEFAENKTKPKTFPQITDLDEEIKLWAKQRFFKLADKKQKKIDPEFLQVNIGWNSASFIQSDQQFRNSRMMTVPKSQILFESIFKNDTDVEQEHALRTERLTRSVCEVQYERGFTVGYEMGLKLGLPEEVISANTGFHKELSLTKKDGETIEEEMKWTIDNQIKVPANSLIRATVDLSECQYSGDFELVTMFKGNVEIDFVDRRSSELLGTFPVVDLVEDIFDRLKKPGFEVVEVGKDKAVKVLTIGRCKFSFGVKQQVTVVKDA